LFSHWFEKKRDSIAASPAAGLWGERVARHSGAWAVLRKRLQGEPGLRVFDTGYTSPVNINFLTGLGHSVYQADLEADAWTGNWQTSTDENGGAVWDVEGFLEHTFSSPGRMYDVALLWTALDYLPEAMVAPVVARLHMMMSSGGQVLALFHTRMQGAEALRCRFHLTAEDAVEVQQTQQFPIQRTFSNRSIERLFSAWAGHRQFLAKDSVSEVIITR
jgi:hypothetical protein